MCWSPPCKAQRYQFVLGLTTRKGAWQSRDTPGATSSSVPCLSLACSQSAGVAGRHAALEFSASDNSFILQDFNSPHGTFVNSCQVQNAAVRVRPGDILSFGTTGASFELVVDGAAQVWGTALARGVGMSREGARGRMGGDVQGKVPREEWMLWPMEGCPGKDG